MPPGECVAVSGFDAGAAEVLVNLVTGASLPDEGEVRVLGQLTADISGGDDWLASLDRFGIVSPRGVLLEGATIEQNLALPLTLSIDPVPPEIAVRVAHLALQVRDRGGGRDRVVAAGDRRNAAAYPGPRPPRACRRARAGAARARAPGRRHSRRRSAPRSQTALRRLPSRGTSATLVITKDDDFAKRAAPRALRLEPATGALTPIKKGWFR